MPKKSKKSKKPEISETPETPQNGNEESFAPDDLAVQSSKAKRKKTKDPKGSERSEQNKKNKSKDTGEGGVAENLPEGGPSSVVSLSGREIKAIYREFPIKKYQLFSPVDKALNAIKEFKLFRKDESKEFVEVKKALESIGEIDRLMNEKNITIEEFLEKLGEAGK